MLAPGEDHMKKLLMTGAAGNMGTALRSRISPLADELLLSDLEEIEVSTTHETYMRCDLADAEAVDALMCDVDAIIHLGGVASEAPFDMLMSANIVGTYNLYEAARRHGVKRILLASTNHVVGFYRQDQYVDPSMPMRPDGLYAVSKCYSEALARLYYDKFGIETAIVRVGACWPEPTTIRMLSLWLSFDDLAALVERVFIAPKLGCPVIFGASANSASWWDNSSVSYLGWQPQDNAERFRSECERIHRETGAPASDRIFQGGRFTDDPIYR